MSAPIHCACPKCQTRIAVPPHLAGGKGACPNCQQRLQFPGAPPINRTVLAPPIAPTPAPPPQPVPVAHFAPVPVENTLDFSQVSPGQHRHEYEEDYRQRYYQDRGPGGLAIASLVLGVVALVTVAATCLWPVSMVCAILGLIFAGSSLSNRSSGMATAGLVTSLIALALMLVVLIAAAAISV